MDDGEKPARKTRRERFEKVAERRTSRVLKEIILLGNCSNRNAYEYADPDVDQIFEAIEKELQKAKARFAKPDRKKEVVFKLGGGRVEG